MKPLKNALLSIRITHEQKERLQEIEQLTRITASILIQESIDVAYDYVQRHGEITFPFRLVPAKKLAAAKIVSD